MKRIMLLAALLTISFAAETAADDQSWTDYWKKAGDYLKPPSMSLPDMPTLSVTNLSGMGDAVMAQVAAFIQEVNESLPLLEKMGYEVSIIGVQSSPPKLKVRMRSKPVNDPAKVFETVDTANQNALVKTLVWSAAEAKRIQNTMNFGTAIVDVDFTIPPKVKMSFLKLKKNAADITLEDLDLSCIQD